MLTKQKDDIAEQAVILKALQLGFGVCKPIGDRMPYDLVFDVDGRLLKIQVKSVWFDETRRNYVKKIKFLRTGQEVICQTKTITSKVAGSNLTHATNINLQIFENQ